MLTNEQSAFLTNLGGADWTINADAHDDCDTLITVIPNFGEGDKTQEFFVSSFKDFVEQIKAFWESYDPDYETYVWLGPDGHGMNGAPHRIRDILDDCETFADKLHDLVLELTTQASKLV